MVESLIITLREGIEAALVVGIILTYLNKVGKTALKKMVYLGLAISIIASIAFAIVFQLLNLDPENEYLEGSLLIAAGIMVATLVIWMWRVSKSIKTEVEKKLGNIVNQKNVSAQGLGLMAFTFLMVFREGAETVLFLMGSTLGKFDLLSFIGGGLGIGLAVLFAIFFIRGSLRINMSRFFTVTSIVLILLALKLLLSGLHEYAERGLLLLTPTIMSFIGFFVRDNTSTLFLIVLLMVPLVVILWDTRTLRPASQENIVSTVEKRKLMAARRQERIWRLSLILASLFIIFAMGWLVFAGGPGYDDPQPIPVESADGEVRIPIAELAEGKLTKYTFNADGTQVRFLLVRLADNSISTALDVCRICGSVGYGQGSETAICKRCVAPIALDTIGQGGGCNPLPLAASTDGEKVVIAVEELIKGKEEF